MTAGPAKLLEQLRSFIVGYSRDARAYVESWRHFDREAGEPERSTSATNWSRSSPTAT